MHITVVQEKARRDPSSSENVSMEIEGIRYKLCPNNKENIPILSWKSGDKNTRVVEVYMNWRHPVLVHAQRESMSAAKQVLIRETLFHHVDLTTDEPLSVSQISQKIAELHEKIARKLLDD